MKFYDKNYILDQNSAENLFISNNCSYIFNEKMEVSSCDKKTIQNDQILDDGDRKCNQIQSDNFPAYSSTKNQVVDPGNVALELGSDIGIQLPDADNILEPQDIVFSTGCDNEISLAEEVVVQTTNDVNSSNVISISDDQILKIEYKGTDGFVNTQYIIHNVNGSFVDTSGVQIDNIFQVNEDPSSTPQFMMVIPTSTESSANNSNEVFGMSTPTSIFGVPKSEIVTSGDIFDVSHEELITFDATSKKDIVSTEPQNNTTFETTKITIEESCPTDKVDNSFKSSMLSPISEDDTNSETDLTSLNWLHNITNIMAVPNLPTPPISPKPKKKNQPSSPDDLSININFYKRNGDKKPPFSYATLICMAMGKNGNKMTLSAIYHWIRENFLYYKKADPNWQNSIRHNLSLNKCFIKVARSKDEPGKGGFWKLDLERLEESRRSKRRSNLTVRAPRSNRQQEQVVKPVRKAKRYRSYQRTGERKHNILSNISIYGETEIENINCSKTNRMKKEKMIEFCDVEDCNNTTANTSATSSNGDDDDAKSIKDQKVPLTTTPTSMPNQNVIIEHNHILPEDDLTGLLLASNGWDDCQLEMLDSLLDSL